MKCKDKFSLYRNNNVPLFPIHASMKSKIYCVLLINSYEIEHDHIGLVLICNKRISHVANDYRLKVSIINLTCQRTHNLN